MMRLRIGGTLIELIVVIAVAGCLLSLLLPAVQQVRATSIRLRCVNNLRSLALSSHGWHDSNGRLPPGTHGRLSTSARPAFMNWHSHLLLYLEQEPLHQIVWETVPVGSTEPPAGRDVVVPVFGCPADARTGVAWKVASAAVSTGHTLVALTSYLGNSGTNYQRRDGVLYVDSATTLVNITDGTSNTLLIGERPPSPEVRFGWWHSGIGQGWTGVLDSTLGSAEKNGLRRSYGAYTNCPLGPYRFTSGRIDHACDVFHYWSLHSGGANFAFCDGSVRFLRYEVADLLLALATRAGGEVVSLD